METELKKCRIVAQYNNLFDIAEGEKIVRAECSGKLLFAAENAAELPAVGDWVLADIVEEGHTIIHEILPRKTKLSRKNAGTREEEQVIATNIDMLGIVTALDNNLNLNRIERFVAIAKQSKINPVIIFNKIDLAKDLAAIKKEASTRFKELPVYFLCALTGKGLDAFQKEVLQPETTTALVGSSGVGKSTIINDLLEGKILATKTIREKDSKGRHTTTNRHLYVLPNKAMIIDNPGIRELGIWQADQGIEKTFAEIKKHSINCRFNNCQHITEPDCGVLTALAEGSLDQEQYDNYIKLKKENAFLKRRTNPKENSNSKKHGKAISKQIKKLKS